jgi:tRNA 2-thiouridine synthesizing protein A
MGAKSRLLRQGRYSFFSMRLDLRGLYCPLPAPRTRKMLRRLAQGDCLIAERTDPLSVIDIPRLLRETRDRLLHHEATNRLFIFHIKRGNA